MFLNIPLGSICSVLGSGGDIGGAAETTPFWCRNPPFCKGFCRPFLQKPCRKGGFLQGFCSFFRVSAGFLQGFCKVFANILNHSISHSSMSEHSGMHIFMFLVTGCFYLKRMFISIFCFMQTMNVNGSMDVTLTAQLCYNFTLYGILHLLHPFR